MTEFLKNLWRHLRIGYVSGLIVIDVVAVIIVFLDIRSYLSLNLSIAAAVTESLRTGLSRSRGDVFGIFVAFSLLLPIFIAIVRVKLGAGPRLPGPFGVRNRLIVFGHLTLTILMAYSVILVEAMQTISGLRITHATETFAFTSLVLTIISVPVSQILFWLLCLATLVAPVIFEITLRGEKTPQWFQDYLSRSFLTDLGGELYPVNGRHKLNFNAAAIAPSIRFIEEYSIRRMKEYQNSIPGSKASTVLLESILNEARELLRHLLLSPDDRPKYEIEFFPSTSRAMEVALLRSKPNAIILSPFEHPTENDTALWYSSLNGCTLHKLNFTPSDYSKAWEMQEDLIIEQISSALSGFKGKCLFVISKVCYATGLVIPLANIRNRLSAKLPDVQFTLLVDAAHAVGNGFRLIDLSESHLYLFSAHKWLLSPEPCGILLTPKETLGSSQPYDCWSSAIPSSTSSARMIISFAGALKLLNNIRLDVLWMRSTELRKRFLKKIDSKFITVGHSKMQQTFIVAIYPVAGWRYDLDELAKHLESQTVNSLVLRIDLQYPWVRVTFPYFLEASELDRLYKALDGALKK